MYKIHQNELREAVMPKETQKLKKREDSKDA
jgi:hypothetical protein